MSSVTSKWAKQSGGPSGDEVQNLVVAAPLSHGSNPNSNMAGRRREDDVNLVVEGVSVSENQRAEVREMDYTRAINRAGGKPGQGYALVRQTTYSIVPEAGQGADLRASEVTVSTALDSLNANEHDRGVRVVEGSNVRRLTPKECERLQALPDDWTGHGVDTKRYAALGDAVTVSVAEWIGCRILAA